MPFIALIIAAFPLAEKMQRNGNKHGASQVLQAFRFMHEEALQVAAQVSSVMIL